MKYVFQSIFISAVLLLSSHDTCAMNGMGSPKFALANTSPTNSAWNGEVDRTGRLSVFIKLAESDDLRLDDAMGSPKLLPANTSPTNSACNDKSDGNTRTRLRVFAELTEPDLATEADRIVRPTLKPESPDAGVNFSALRSSLIANRDADLKSLLIAHRALTVIINREKDSMDRTTQVLQILDKDIEILALHNEITRELIIRNNQNPNQALCNMIKSYKQTTYSLCYTISRGFMGAKIKMKHHARHIWGECTCNLFPADPL